MRHLAILVIFGLAILLHPAIAWAQSVPYTQNFNAAEDWSSLIFVEAVCSEEERGQTTHVTTGCYSGGCMKIVPPKAACTGEGINGGGVGLYFILSGMTDVMHVRFLVKFGPTLRDNTQNGGGGLLNKFVNLWSDYGDGTREGILKTQVTIPDEDPRGLFMSFAIEGAASYIYESPPSRGWIQDTDLLIDTNSTNNRTASDADGRVWLSVEYMIDKGNSHTEMWVYDVTGLIQNVEDTKSFGDGDFNALQLGGYWNAYVTADTDAYILIDNLQVSTSYIGPPDGFVGGSTPARKLNNVTGVRVTLH